MKIISIYIILIMTFFASLALSKGPGRALINISDVNNFSKLTPSIGFVSPDFGKDLAQSKQKIITVLSIDGGGVYGVLPANILKVLEERTGQPISKLFDVMVGTSTGALLVSGLTVPNKNHKPRYTAAQIIQFYNSDGAKIFKQSFWHSVRTVRGLFGPRFSDKNIDRLINKLFGKKTKLSQLLSHVIVPCGEILNYSPFWFNSNSAKSRQQQDFYVVDMVKAAVAAPYIFSPYRFSNISGDWHNYGVDAAIFINNPTLQAYLDAKALYPHHQYLIVSLGTGVNIPSKKFMKRSEFEHFGFINGIIPVVTAAYAYHAQQTEYQMRMLMKEKSAAIVGYFRFNIKLKTPQRAFDGSKKNLKKINSLASLMVRRNLNNLNSLVQILNTIRSNTVVKKHSI